MNEKWDIFGDDTNFAIKHVRVQWHCTELVRKFQIHAWKRSRQKARVQFVVRDWSKDIEEMNKVGDFFFLVKGLTEFVFLAKGSHIQAFALKKKIDVIFIL